MPCDQIRTVTLELKVANIDLLEKALRRLGWNVDRAFQNTGLFFTRSVPSYVTGSFRMGERLTLRGAVLEEGRELAAIQQALSREIVEEGCKQFGWEFSEVDAEENVQYAVSKNTGGW